MPDAAELMRVYALANQTSAWEYDLGVRCYGNGAVDLSLSDYEMPLRQDIPMIPMICCDDFFEPDRNVSATVFVSRHSARPCR
jgi:hypothetical protein